MTTQLIIARIFMVCMAACAAMAQSSNLSGIAHVALRVADLEKSRTFYEKLGFEQSFQFDQDGKVSQAFIKINDNQFIELYPRTEEGQSIGLMHVCYEADRIDEVRAAYVKQGLTPTEIKKARAGNLLFVLHDPEGQLVEYTQYLPGSLHSEDRGKHLGGSRISTHLESVTIPVKGVASGAKFYLEKLGFYGESGTSRRLAIPGSADWIDLVGTGTTAQLRFAVEDTAHARADLHAAGLKGRMDKKLVVINDPDGNEIVFQRTAKHLDLAF